MRALLLTCLLFLVFPISTALSEGYKAPNHDKYHHWYKQIQIELKTFGCCDEDNNDCGPVAMFQDLGIHGVEVWLEDGKKHHAAAAKVYYVRTPDGRAHVCRQPVEYSSSNETSFIFYCIFLPIPSG